MIAQYTNISNLIQEDQVEQVKLITALLSKKIRIWIWKRISKNIELDSHSFNNNPSIKEKKIKKLIEIVKEK